MFKPIIMISKVYPNITFNLKGKAGVHSNIIEKLKKEIYLIIKFLMGVLVINL